MKPLPYTPDRLPVGAAIAKFAAAHPKPAIVWIADGLDRGHGQEFAHTLAGISSDVTLVTDETNIRALAGAENLPVADVQYGVAVR